jgi:hypothetical protein
MARDRTHWVSRATVVWAAASVTWLFATTRYDASEDTPVARFFRCGPSPDFVAFGGLAIDTWPRYAALVAFCAINSIVRTLHAEVITPWITTRVQGGGGSGVVDAVVRRHAHEVVTSSVAYVWFDWLMSLGILLSQADVVLVEVACNVAAAALTTRAYLGGTGGPTAAGQGDGEEPLLSA